MKKFSFCFTSDKDYADVFSLLNKDGKSKSCMLQMIFEIGCNVVKEVLKGTGLKPFQQPSLFDNDEKVKVKTEPIVAKKKFSKKITGAIPKNSVRYYNSRLQDVISFPRELGLKYLEEGLCNYQFIPFNGGLYIMLSKVSRDGVSHVYANPNRPGDFSIRGKKGAFTELLGMPKDFGEIFNIEATLEVNDGLLLSISKREISSTNN